LSFELGVRSLAITQTCLPARQGYTEETRRFTEKIHRRVAGDAIVQSSMFKV